MSTPGRASLMANAGAAADGIAGDDVQAVIIGIAPVVDVGHASGFRSGACPVDVKSANVGRPYGLTKIFAGLISRCRRPPCTMRRNRGSSANRMPTAPSLDRVHLC